MAFLQHPRELKFNSPKENRQHDYPTKVKPKSEDWVQEKSASTLCLLGLHHQNGKEEKDDLTLQQKEEGIISNGAIFMHF